MDDDRIPRFALAHWLRLVPDGGRVDLRTDGLTAADFAPDAPRVDRSGYTVFDAAGLAVGSGRFEYRDDGYVYPVPDGHPRAGRGGDGPRADGGGERRG